MRCDGVRQRGVGLLTLLILLAVLSTVAASTVQIGARLQRRAAERELLFVGGEFQRALASYAAVSPAGAPRAPKSLDELTRDPRSATLRRHLRRVYLDPLTGHDDWGLVRAPDGGILALHSRSDDRPLQETGFEPSLRQLESRARYSEWWFGSVVRR